MRSTSTTSQLGAKSSRTSVTPLVKHRCRPLTLRVASLGGGATPSQPPSSRHPAKTPAAASASPASTSVPTTQQEQQPNAAGEPAIIIPRSIHDVDNGKILGFGPGLSEDHPGFHDPKYKQRRVDICNIARMHRIGEPIPRVQYAPEETAVWATVLQELQELYPKHACAAFNRSFPLFDFREEEVPQLDDLSQVLQRSTGWQIRPVAGLMHPRDFLAGLAFKTFHSTQYMRHHSKPNYTPEPDVCHELLGHVPMLADPAFCELAQTIGRASLGADEKTIWHLTKIYWYTVEFGVVRERGDIKAFGAGVLSSFGELKHMASGAARLEPFDPFQKQPKMSYKDGYQLRYFVLESFEDGAAKLKAYCASLALPEELRGNPNMA